MSGAAPAPPPPPGQTWNSVQRLGFNSTILNDYDKTSPFDDTTRTMRGPYTYAGAGYGGTTPTAAVKANGQPAEDFCCILVDNGVAADVGTYLCGFTGHGTPQNFAGDNTITSVNYDAPSNTTTFAIVRGAFTGGDTRVSIKIQGISGDFGDVQPFYALRPGVLRSDLGRIWNPDFIASIAPCTSVRWMNWGLINGSTETGPTGAVAFNTDPFRYGFRLATQVALCNAQGKHFWGNLPALSNGAYRDQYIGQVQSTLLNTLLARIEHANEPWNTNFSAYGQLMAQMQTATLARVGAAITSVNKATGTVTAQLVASHTKSVGDQISIVGVNNITRKVATLIAGTDGPTGVLKWTDTAGNATGGLDVNSCIYLNPTHVVCNVTSSGLPVADIFEAKENWDIYQCRDIYTRIAAAGGSSRMKPTLGLKLADKERCARMLQWTLDTYGDVNWMVWAPAYYAQPDNQATLDTLQKWKDALDAARLVSLKRLWQFLVICKSYGVASTSIAFYEMGPHTETKTGGTQAACKAVHESDWMRLFCKQLLQDVANIAKTFCMWFEFGAIDDYGTTADNTWPLAEPHISNSVNSAKWKAMNETAPAAYAPVAVDGYTWGTIDSNDAISWISTHAAGNLIIFPNDILPVGGLGYPLQVDAGGAKTVQVFCGVNAADKFDVLIDGIEVAHQVTPPDQNVFGVAAALAWTGNPTLTAGEHTLSLRFGSTRAGHVGLANVVTS